MAEPWMSVEDIAKHLGVAKDSVYRWIERRGLPAHKIGRLWKFNLKEVDDWVRAGGTAVAPDGDSSGPESEEGRE
ncbi:MAG: helix-turn-helix domain-containing protein [Pseudomonadota bacterium]